MKKYITLAALLTAGTAFASAEIITITSFSESSTESLLSSKPSGFVSGQSASSVGVDNISLLAGVATDANNWYWDVMQSTSSISGFNAESEVTFSTSESVTTLSFSVRTGVSGEFIYNKTTLSNLLSDSQELSDVSVSFNTSSLGSSSTAFVFALYKLDSEGNASLLGDKQTISSTGETSYTISAANLSSTDSVIAYFGGSAGQANRVSVNSLSVTGTVIPEPSAFGLLAGLGALALVGARRRRR